MYFFFDDKRREWGIVTWMILDKVTCLGVLTGSEPADIAATVHCTSF